MAQSQLPSLPRIAAVDALVGPHLTVTWTSGGRDDIDLSGWIATGGAFFAQLSDTRVFASAVPAEYGTMVQWAGDDNLVIDAFHLALLAEQQRPFGSAELTAWQQQLGLSNAEAADLLDIGRSTWHGYKSGDAAIPAAVRIACRAVARDKVLFEAYYRPRPPAGRPRKSAP